MTEALARSRGWKPLRDEQINEALLVTPCFVEGIAYPKVLDDTGREDLSRAANFQYDVRFGDISELNRRFLESRDPALRKQLYDHPFTKLRKSEVGGRDNALYGLAVLDTHRGAPVGKVVMSKVQPDGAVHITASMDDWGVKRRVYKGEFEGFSMGFDRNEQTGELRLKEVSLTKRPFYEQAVITHIASGEDVLDDREQQQGCDLLASAADPLARILHGPFGDDFYAHFGVASPFRGPLKAAARYVSFLHRCQE
jgi:hypothetical protein